MPKMKTNKATSKRFKPRKSGKFRFKTPQARHLLTLKGTKRKRQKRAAAFASVSDSHKLTRLLPYGAN